MTSIADSSLHADAEADETTFNGTVSDFSSQSSRQASPQLSQPAPMKVLTRPVSSGQHPAAGFSFTKAKPIQQFDFRRPKQLQSPPLPDTAQTVQNAINLTDHRVPSPKHVLKDPLPVPFPNIVPARSRAYGHSTPNTAKDVSRPNASLSDAPLNEVPMPADDVLTDSVLNGTKPLLTAPVFSHSPSEMIGTVDKQPVHMQHRSNKKSKDFLTSVAGTPKITKSRWRKPKTGPTTKGPNRKDTYTDVDLLNLLMYRRRQGQQELDNFRATQSGMEAEMLKLRDMTNDLSGQLQEAIHRTTQKSAELSKVKSSMPIWESKIKRLSDYVKGLTNDHKRLREDADDMNKQYQHVFVAKKQLQNTLDDARKSFEQERIRFQQLDDDARHKVETLTQTIQHQSTQLQTDEDLLMVERERSDRLEEQIVRVTTSHGQLSEILTGHRDSIACKIDELLHQARSIVPPNGPPESNSHNSIKPMLEQCFGILQELHKTTHVKPEDLQRLNNNMDTFAEGYVPFV